MKTKPFFISAIIVLLGFLTSGCVEVTRVKDEPRQTVRFSSPEAAQTFYDAYLAVHSPRGHGWVTISCVKPPYWQRTVATDNVRFNRVVKTVDRNHDGIISDDEASAYASRINREIKKEGT